MAADSSPVAIIPLEPYLRAQAIVRATIAGQTGVFMFDTGEGISSISPDFAQKIGCRPWGKITGFRMSGERLDTPHCDQVVYRMAEQSFNAPAVIVLDIMSFLGADVPPIDGAIGLDIFASRAITIVPRRAIIVESPGSLGRRVLNAKELPIRIVRDAEGLSLEVNGAVPTSEGLAWMELDTGNGGSMVIANHIAPLLGLSTDVSTPAPLRFALANGVWAEGPARTRDLIMDGNIGAQFLNNWVLTLDLQHSKAWLGALPSNPPTLPK